MSGADKSLRSRQLAEGCTTLCFDTGAPLRACLRSEMTVHRSSAIVPTGGCDDTWACSCVACHERRPASTTQNLSPKPIETPCRTRSLRKEPEMSGGAPRAFAAIGGYVDDVDVDVYNSCWLPLARRRRERESPSVRSVSPQEGNSLDTGGTRLLKALTLSSADCILCTMWCSRCARYRVEDLT